MREGDFSTYSNFRVHNSSTQTIAAASSFTWSVLITFVYNILSEDNIMIHFHKVPIQPSAGIL